MKKKSRIGTLLCLILLSGLVSAQRISFGLYATDDIMLTPIGEGELNFNDKIRAIVPGSMVEIMLEDESSAIVAIDGRADLDVNVTIDADPGLVYDEQNTIPFTIGLAYSNVGAATVEIAKMQAIQLPAGFTSITFPLQRQTNGLPGTPPTPDHTGYIAPAGTAYLFVYGTLGPVPQNAVTGLYTGQINIRVEYSSYSQ